MSITLSAVTENMYVRSVPLGVSVTGELLNVTVGAGVSGIVIVT